MVQEGVQATDKGELWSSVEMRPALAMVESHQKQYDRPPKSLVADIFLSSENMVRETLRRPFIREGVVDRNVLPKKALSSRKM